MPFYKHNPDPCDPIFWFSCLGFWPPDLSTLPRFASIRRAAPIVLYLCAGTDYATRANVAQQQKKEYKIKYLTPAVGWRSNGGFYNICFCKFQ